MATRTVFVDAAGVVQLVTMIADEPGQGPARMFTADEVAERFGFAGHFEAPLDGDPVLARLEVGDAVPVQASPGTSRVEPVPAGVVKATPAQREALDKVDRALDVARGQVVEIDVEAAPKLLELAAAEAVVDGG